MVLSLDALTGEARRTPTRTRQLIDLKRLRITGKVELERLKNSHNIFLV